MPTRTYAPRGRLLKAALLTLAFALALSVHANALAQTEQTAQQAAQTAQDDPERASAFELFDNQKFADAIPLLEKAAVKYPSDGQVLARLGLALVADSVTISDAEKRKSERARGRGFLARAKEQGVTNDLIESMLSGIAPDGSTVGGDAESETFSSNREADEAMRAGEQAFTHADYPAALKAYERAMQLDPNIYEAPLFAGDTYAQTREWDKAAESYARAAKIEPDKETAYRYWGNALIQQARLDEARDKYVEAIIADPYNSYVWRNGLFHWAEKKGVHLGHPKIEPMSSVSPMKENEMTITIDPKSLGKEDGTSAWAVYGIARAAWTTNNNERFRKQYPSEKEYRHSLAEEADALRLVIESVKQQAKKGKVKQLDPALKQLVKLDDDGLLEAYILLARPDEGVAQDYAEYRRANRDKLRRYLIEYVTSGKY